MQVVIDIPEEDYIRLRDEGMFGNVTTFKRAVREGIPLPKGHGRLIDADEANEVMRDIMCGTGYQGQAMRVIKSEIYTPTIIEADRSERSDKV